MPSIALFGVALRRLLRLGSCACDAGGDRADMIGESAVLSLGGGLDSVLVARPGDAWLDCDCELPLPTTSWRWISKEESAASSSSPASMIDLKGGTAVPLRRMSDVTIGEGASCVA